MTRGRLFLAVFWLGSVIAAWFLGSLSEGVRGPEPNRYTARRDAARRESDGRVDPIAVVARSKTDPEAGTPAAFEAGELPDFRSARTAGDAYDLLFRYYDVQLKRGPDGHRALLRAFGKIAEDEMLQDRFLSDPGGWERQTYRVVRFLIGHEKEAVELFETMLKAAAANRPWFRELSPETLFELSQYWAYLPGMVDDKKLAHLSLLLEKVLALDPASLAPAVDNYLDVLQELYDSWAAPLTPEEVQRLLTDPSVSDGEKLVALRRAPAESLQGLNLIPILVPRIRMDAKAIIAALAGLKFSSQEIAALDEAMYAALSLAGDRYWNVDVFLNGTRSDEWPVRQAFYDEGIRRGGKVLHNLLMAIEYEPHATRGGTSNDCWRDPA